jgi:lipoprotein NlpI
MYRCFVLSLAIAGLTVAITASGLAQQAAGTSAPDTSTGALRAQSLAALQAGDTEAAIRIADDMVRLYPKDPTSLQRGADIYLRAGKCQTAVEVFDQYLQLQPDQMPYLWQRGIALYFAGDFKEGARQFEAHREVNPEDVENAAWHFLCVAKAESFTKARQMVLPAPNDPRVPMKEVLQMLTSGDSDAVRRKVESLPVGSPPRADAEFYGDLYLGLYADAEGDLEQARRWISRAAEQAPRHYMGDVARVYAKHLAR